MNKLGNQARNRKIIKTYQKGYKTLDELGKVYGLTRQRIHQIVKLGLTKD